MKVEEALEVIEALRNEKKKEFSSHNFIKKYAWYHEKEYVEMLYDQKTN